MFMQRVTVPTKGTPVAVAATLWSPLLNRSARLVQRKCACGGTPGATGECEGCRKKRLSLQCASSSRSSFIPHASEVPLIVHDVLRSPGQPLDPATSAFMEPRFGHDFTGVRVHTNAQAAESARAVHARAYTVGNAVVFAADEFAPTTVPGQRLLAHELTHVVQQSGVQQSGTRAAATPLTLDHAGSPLEREADESSSRLVAGQSRPNIHRGATNTLQRDGEDEERRLPSTAPQLGQSLGLPQSRPGFNLPSLQLDPQIAAQIRAIQFMQGLLSIEQLTAAASQTAGGTAQGAPTLPGARPQLLPSLPPPAAGGLTPAGGLGLPPTPTAPPLVPRGAGPETPGPASIGDLLKAVLQVPAVQSGVATLRTQAEGRLRSDWSGLSGGERALVITHSVVLAGGALAGIATNAEARQFVLNQVQGKTIPIPGTPMTFQFNLTGPDQRLVLGLDVGALLPPQLGFGPRK